MKRKIKNILISILIYPHFLMSQQIQRPAVLEINVAEEIGKMYPVWAWFGLDTMNPNIHEGRKEIVV